MTGQEYIMRNDFEGAYARFKKATKRWKAYWFEVCEKIYSTCEDWAEKYLLDPVQKIIEPILNYFWGTRRKDRVLYDGITPLPEGTQQFYLIELLDENNELVYSKIGTTTRHTDKRMFEHLSYYKDEGVKYIVVKRLWDCGAEQAEYIESLFRSHYMRKYPNTWKQNDRFTKVKFDYDEADKFFTKVIDPNFSF